MLFHPGPTHYDLAIDGALAPPTGFPSEEATSRGPEGKTVYTRTQLLGKVAGEETVESVTSAAVKRVWPSEPAVGFSAPEMAFKVDGRLRIGGPTLKTYTLNALSSLSRVRESLVQMNDTYRKLQASEDQLEQADMLNAVGAWYTEDTATVGVTLGIVSGTQIQGDARTYAASGADTVQLLRRGAYLISYRLLATPNAGGLTITLTVGSSTYTWSGTGLPTTLTVVDQVTYIKTDDTTTNITLTNTLGTAVGDTGANGTYFQIVKLR